MRGRESGVRTDSERDTEEREEGGGGYKGKRKGGRRERREYKEGMKGKKV